MPRKVTPPDSAAVERRKYNAERLIYRAIFEGQTAADAWFAVHPKANCKRDSAKRMAAREMDWYRVNHPLEMRTLLYLHKLDDSTLIEQLKKQLDATMALKTKIVRTVTKRPDGETTTTEEIEYADVPDWRARDAALQKWMILADHMAKGGLAGAPAAGTAPPKQASNGTTVTDPTGPQRVEIEAPEKVHDHDERQRRYQETLTAPNPERDAALKFIEDMERKAESLEQGNNGTF